MAVRAKMKCTNKQLTVHTKSDRTTVEAASVTLEAVCADTGAPRTPENEIFGEYTPNARITMYITNPGAHEQFIAGKYYYVDLTPAE